VADAVLLIGDIGGTNARFALADGSPLGYSHELTLQCADFNTPEVAIEHYLNAVGAAQPEVICLAAAGPIVDNSIKFTNNHWLLAGTSLKVTFHAGEVRLLNDFEAVAYSLPAVSGTATEQLGELPLASLTSSRFTACVMGPGTGLGAAGLVARAGQTSALVTEAGHVGFAPESELQTQLLQALRQRYGRVSDERVVSGMGIENIYWGLGEINGTATAPVSAADIFEKARSGDEQAAQAVDLFFEILGQIAGNLVLSLGAFDGAYIAGGIAQRHADLLLSSHFRRGFENKGRHSQLLKAVPSALITHAQPGLAGAASVARRLAGQE